MTQMLSMSLHQERFLFEDFMKPVHLGTNEPAQDIHVPPNRIGEIVRGKRANTADTVLRLGKYFGVQPEVSPDLQSKYDLHVLQRTTWPKIEAKICVPAA